MAITQSAMLIANNHLIVLELEKQMGQISNSTRLIIHPHSVGKLQVLEMDTTLCHANVMDFLLMRQEA